MVVCTSVRFRFGPVEYVYVFLSIACVRRSVKGSGKCCGWPRPIRPIIVRRSNLNHREIFLCPAGSRLRVYEASPPVEMPRPFQDRESADPTASQPPHVYARGPLGSTDGIPFFQTAAAINVRACPVALCSDEEWRTIRRHQFPHICLETTLYRCRVSL